MTPAAPVLLMEILVEFDRDQIERLGVGHVTRRLWKYEDGTVLCFPFVRADNSVSCFMHPTERCSGVREIERYVDKEKGR